MLLKTYLTLIGNEVKSWRIPGREQQDTNRWWIIYLIAGVLIGLSFITYVAVQGGLNPRYLWTFSIGFPFVAFGMVSSRKP